MPLISRRYSLIGFSSAYEYTSVNHNPPITMISDKPQPTLDQLARARMIAFAMVGVLIVTAAIFVARYFEVGLHIGLDLQGERVTGLAEPNGDGSYRLRYETADGIHARTYRGGFGLQDSSSEHPFDVEFVADPEKPGRFQPAGLSYLPGVLTLAIFCVGMACIFHARRIAILQRRYPTKY